MHGRQIFFDPSGRRRHLVNLTLFAGLAAVVVGFGALAAGLVIAPELNQTVDVSRASPAVADGGRWRRDPLGTPPSLLPTYQRVWPASAVTSLRFGFFESSDWASYQSMQDHVAQLDALIPDFLSYSSPDRELEPRDKKIESRVRAFLGGQERRVAVYAEVSLDRDPIQLAATLSDPQSRARLVRSIADYVEVNDDAGTSLSLEEIPASTYAGFLALLSELQPVLHADGRKLLVIASPDRINRLGEIARLADYVLVDLHQNEPGSGALASQAWFEKSLAQATAVVAPHQLVVGIGSHAIETIGKTKVSSISVQRAWSRMTEAGAALGFDARSLNPSYSVVSGDGLRHDTWILDGVSVYNQIAAALPHRPAGLALWRLGTEDPSAWASFGRGRAPDARARDELTRPGPGFDIDFDDWHPEVVALKFDARNGRRAIAYDETTRLIVGEELPEVPQRVVFGGAEAADPKQLAITFDDGPDPEVTPRILDVLRDKNVKASFFVVGMRALEYKGILRRIYDEGHDIGNHTYSHPRWQNISPTVFQTELNGCQRVLEALLGIHTTLFRLPYAGGWFSDEPESPEAVEAARRLGYVTVFSGVTPGDWLNLSPEVLRDRVVKQVLEGRGHVIVLHDFGQRQATIDALPMIIDTLRAKGYRFGTVHELIGAERADVMAHVAPTGAVAGFTAVVRRFGYEALSQGKPLLFWLAIMGSILCISRFLFVAVFVVRHRRLERQRGDLAWTPASITVIVPAYNEEAVVCNTVESLLKADRHDFEILVVDDGSKDRTAAVVEERYAGNPRVRVFRKPNGGKAAAANFALAHTEADIVICIDADTVLAADAISLLVRHFGDPTVGAVAGTAVVGNRSHLLTRMQNVEYVIGQYVDRRAFAYFNANGIVPGAIGAWRRQALLDAGGYASDTLAEDADATFSVIEAGWKVLYEPRAEAWTEAPENVRAFLKQRYRWMFGMLQVVSKHWNVMSNGKANGLAFITIPNVIVFQFGFSLLIPVLDGIAVYETIVGFNGTTATEVMDTVWLGGFSSYILYWLAFHSLDLGSMIVGLRIAGIEGIAQMIPLILVQRFLYWPMIYFTALRALLGAMKGRMSGWNKLARTGTVKAVPDERAS